MSIIHGYVISNVPLYLKFHPCCLLTIVLYSEDLSGGVVSSG